MTSIPKKTSVLFNSDNANLIKSKIILISPHVLKFISNRLKTHVGKGNEKKKKLLKGNINACPMISGLGKMIVKFDHIKM